MELKINLHITADSAVGALLSKFAEALDAQTGNDRPPAAQTAGAKTGGKKASAGTASDTSVKTTSGATAETSADDTEVDTIDYDGVIKPLILKISKDIGVEDATALLKSYGVKGGKELKPEQYPEFERVAKKLLADHEAKGNLA